VHRDQDVKNFTSLWDTIKDINQIDGFNINISSEQIIKWNDTIKEINDKRNIFIHFSPRHLNIFTNNDFSLGKSCLEIVYHIIFDCKSNLGIL
jgi:hypothetical protein